MVKVDKYDFYDALSYTQWKMGLEILADVYAKKKIPDPAELNGFFERVYWGWKRFNIEGKKYFYLRDLVEEGLAERKVRPLTDEERESDIHSGGFAQMIRCGKGEVFGESLRPVKGSSVKIRAV